METHQFGNENSHMWQKYIILYKIYPIFLHEVLFQAIRKRNLLKKGKLASVIYYFSYLLSLGVIHL